MTPDDEHWFESERILERFDSIPEWLVAVGRDRVAERRRRRARAAAGRRTSTDRPTRCDFCNELLPPYRGGRYRRYCPRAIRNCRDRAYKKRRRAAAEASRPDE